MYDSTGNNVTGENATAQISVSFEAYPGLNGGEIQGNASVIAQFGLATFENVIFNEAGTLKRLTVSGRVLKDGVLEDTALSNATTELIRVLPGPARA
jgi:hypothetical protein